MPYPTPPFAALCSDEYAYQDIVLDVQSELPIVLKAYFYLSATSTVTGASVSLDLLFADASSRTVSTLDFLESSSKGAWTQAVESEYPTQVVRTARVSGGWKIGATILPETCCLHAAFGATEQCTKPVERSSIAASKQTETWERQHGTPRNFAAHATGFFLCSYT